MDLAATRFDAYALFIAPRETDGPSRFAPPPPTAPHAQRIAPIGWLAGAFYGVLAGALMLGVTAAGAPLAVLRCSAIGLAATLLAQALLLRAPARSAHLLAQGLTTPALALVAAGLGALARLQA